MPARLNLRHQQMVRDKIQATQLIHRLHACAMGEVELTATQVRAIEVLLRKAVPDLSAVQVDGDGEGGPVRIERLERVIVRANPQSQDG